MNATKNSIGPKGTTAAAAAKGRARRSEEYREARDEYASIRELRKKNWIAAHIRERRYELELSQKEVAERAGTSHSFISKLERGDHIPTIPVLERILTVLDEQLLIGIERAAPEDEPTGFAVVLDVSAEGSNGQEGRPRSGQLGKRLLGRCS